MTLSIIQIQYQNLPSFLTRALYLLTLPLLLVPIESSGQFDKNDFGIVTKISQKDGLPNWEITCMYQDTTGYMWIGTFDGLIRYDGSSFKTYQHNSSDSNSLSSNVIQDIIEGPRGYLWVSTRGGGLNRYDPVTENFRAYKFSPHDSTSISGNQCSKLFIDQDRDLWISTFSAGFNRYVPETESFIRYSIDDSFVNNRESERINTAIDFNADPTRPHVFWLGSVRKAGLIEFNKLRDSMTFHPADLINRTHIWAQATVSPNEIITGSWGFGLIKFNTQTKKWQKIGEEIKRDVTASPIIRQIIPNGRDGVWLADGGNIGLVYAKWQDSTYSSFAEVQHTDLSDPYLTHIYLDMHDRLWTARQSTIGIHDPNKKLFQFQPLPSATYQPANSYNLYPIITRADTDVTGQVVMGAAEGAGAFLFSPDLKEYETFHPFPKDASFRYSFYDTDTDGQGASWYSGFQGKRLVRYDAINGRVLHDVGKLARDLLPPHVQIVTVNAEKDRPIIWSGTFYGGLIKYNYDEQQLRHFRLTNRLGDTLDREVVILKTLLDRKKGHLWIATNSHGIFLFNVREERIVDHYSPYPNNDFRIDPSQISSIALDKQGDCWVSRAREGVEHLRLKENTIERVNHIDMSDGLPSNSIAELTFDRNNHLWIYSGGGLSRYMPENGLITTFGTESGILHPFSNQTTDVAALAALPDGKLIFGQPRGFCWAHVDSLLVVDAPPKMSFSWFRVKDEDFPLDTNLNHLRTVLLPYQQNFFSIGFSALDFSNIGQVKYAAKLEGLDEDWRIINGSPYVTYTDVREGNYRFRVRSLDAKGEMQDNEIQLQLIVLPPWYRSWWAYLIWVLTALGLAYVIFSALVRRRLAVQEVERVQAFDQVKSRLYTNITHEFRTPLTLILGANEFIADNEKEKQTIERNAYTLLSMVNKMLTISKVESGHYAPDYVQFDLVKHLRYLVGSFESLAARNRQHLSFHSEASSNWMDFDPEIIRQIVHNLVFNALKFTPEYGSIKIVFSAEGNSAMIKVIDNGRGIAPGRLPHIFNRFSEAEHSLDMTEQGTGLGLALVKELVAILRGDITVSSELSVGSQFVVTLPITNKATRVDSVAGYPKTSDLVLPLPSRGIDKNTAPTPPGPERPLILIVEDNHDIIDYLRSLLSTDYRTATATDGETGMAKATDLIPDLILTDVMMPKKSGIALCQEMKADYRISHVPIIMITAKGDQQSLERGLSAGADAYMVKPFSSSELRIRIKNLLQARDRIQQHFTNPLTPMLPVSEASETDNQFLATLLECVRDNLDNYDFKVWPDLCRQVAMSRPQMYRKVQALCGFTPSAFIRSVRMESARQLLVSSALDFHEIASRVGYRRTAYFLKAYLEVYGETPQETRKHLKNNLLTKKYSINQRD